MRPSSVRWLVQGRSAGIDDLLQALFQHVAGRPASPFDGAIHCLADCTLRPLLGGGGGLPRGFGRVVDAVLDRLAETLALVYGFVHELQHFVVTVEHVAVVPGAVGLAPGRGAQHVLDDPSIHAGAFA